MNFVFYSFVDYVVVNHDHNHVKLKVGLLHMRKAMLISSLARALTGPSCWKLTMSLVNDSLKFTSSDTQIC